MSARETLPDVDSNRIIAAKGIASSVRLVVQDDAEKTTVALVFTQKMGFEELVAGRMLVSAIEIA